MRIEQLTEKLKEFGKLRRQKDKLKEQLKLLDAQITEKEPELISVMNKLKIQNMNVKGVGILYLESRAFPNVKDQDKLIKWLKKNNRGSLVKETIHYQTLLGVVNECLRDNMETPEGVEVFTKQEVRLRREQNGE